MSDLFSKPSFLLWCGIGLLIFALIHFVMRWYIFNVMQHSFADEEELRRFKRLFNITKLLFYAVWMGLVLILIFYKFKLGG